MKYCDICGAELEGKAPYCEACGTVCGPQQQQYPPAEQQQAQYPPQEAQYAPPWQKQPYQGAPASEYYPQQMPVNPKYTSIGGWLLFFVIVLCLSAGLNLFSAINGIATNTSAEIQELLLFLDSEWRTANNMEIVAYFIILVVAALQIYAIVQIFTRRHYFLKLIQLAFMAIIVCYIIILIAYGIVGYEYIEGEPAATISSTVSTTISMFINTTYFCRSERVKTFMGGDDYKRNAIFSLK